MTNPTSRMLSLLSLLQTHRHWSGTELAQRLNVTTRTIRRDVDRLRELGYPVAAAAGSDGGYRLEAGRQLPPLLLDDEEAVAIAVGLRTAATGAVSGIEEASVRALAKLEQVLPARLRRRLSAMNTYMVPLVSGDASVDPEHLAVIALACRDHERLRFKYSAYDGTVSRRTAEPHRLVSAGRRWYLVAWDCDREAWRTFRVDRLEQLQPTAVRFRERPLPEGDAAAFVAEAIRTPFSKHQAVLRLHAPVGALRDRVPPSAGVLEADGDDRCVLRTATDSLEWLAMFVGVLGVDFEIIDPPELSECISAIGDRFGRAAVERKRASVGNPAP